MKPFARPFARPKGLCAAPCQWQCQCPSLGAHTGERERAVPGTGLSQANAVARRLCAALCQWQGQCSSFGARPARLLSAQPMAKRLLAIRGGAGAWPPPLKAPHWLGLWPVRSSFAVRAPCAHQRKGNASHMAKRFQRRAGHRQGRERLARIATPFSTEGEAITRERHSRSTALCEGTADQQRPRSYGTAANQALKGFTAMMPQYNCPSLKSSVRMRSQPSRSAAATICAS